MSAAISPVMLVFAVLTASISIIGIALAVLLILDAIVQAVRDWLAESSGCPRSDSD